jgi:toxin ParE1/3/4
LKRYRLKSEAAAELIDAVGYLAERSPQAAASLVGDYEKALRLVRSFPEGFAPGADGSRKHGLSRHPYSLVYLLEKGVVIIIAFMHQKRRPGYWTPRLNPKKAR